jgi:hypothetical protein
VTAVAETEDLEARVTALTSALERTERNLLLAVQGKPVYDVEETLAENRAALRHDHARVCCLTHGTHASLHVGCILR